MNREESINFKQLRVTITAIITVLIGSLLLWNHFHGGVPSHHILDQKDLPSISNWWGGLLLPLLTWILLGRINTRLNKQGTTAEDLNVKLKDVVIRFCIGLALGIMLAASFVNNFKPFLDNVLYIILVLALFVPIFYAEFILGFVLGMTYTFGVILPTAFILIMSLPGFVLYKYIRRLIMRLFGKK
ncbi:MAG: hypothetical protein QM726_19765 [Chitinophagaceae bacterium]